MRWLERQPHAPADFSEARKALSSLGIIIGRSYFEFDLSLQGRQAMMRNDASALCQLCLADGAAMQQLVASHAISHEAQVSLAAGLVLDAVLDSSSIHATIQDALCGPPNPVVWPAQMHTLDLHVDLLVS